MEISVIIPAWNRRELLREGLESVLAQGLGPGGEPVPVFEVLVVDDGSDDGTEEMMKGWAAEAARGGRGEDGGFSAGDGGPELRYLRLEHCGFPGAVRNRGAEAARGNWLAFLDSDDLWRPGKLARQMEFHRQNPEPLISHTREEWRRGERLISQKKFRHKREGDLFEDSLVKCIIGPSTVMIRRDLYESAGGFREDLEIAEDYEFWLRLTAGHRVGYLEEPLTVKRAGLADQGQLSEKYGQIEIFRLQGLKELAEGGFFPPERQGAAEAELARKAAVYAAGCRKRGRTEEARGYEELADRFKGSQQETLDGISRAGL